MRELNSVFRICSKLNTISAIGLFACLFFMTPGSSDVSNDVESSIESIEETQDSNSAISANSEVISIKEF